MHRKEVVAAQANGSDNVPCEIPRSNTPKEDDVTVAPVDAAAHVCQPCGCTPTVHVCAVNAEMGCASCHRTFHANCDSHLCDYTPCGICASFSLTTHENSTLCVQAQTDNVGCHACCPFNAMGLLHSNLQPQQLTRQMDVGLKCGIEPIDTAVLWLSKDNVTWREVGLSSCGWACAQGRQRFNNF